MEEINIEKDLSLKDIENKITDASYYVEALKLSASGSQDNIASDIVSFFATKIEENLQQIREQL